MQTRGSMKHMSWNTNVYLPINSSKMRMPKDQQSAPKSWPLFMMTSGATYSGVPQNVQVFLPSPIFLAKPKSVWKNIYITEQIIRMLSVRLKVAVSQNPCIYLVRSKSLRPLLKILLFCIVFNLIMKRLITNCRIYMRSLFKNFDDHVF